MGLSALGSRDFRLYIAGNLFALNAMWMLRIVVGWLAWDLTGSAGFVGLIALCHFLPSMIFGPLFGVFVDRVNVRHAAIAVQSLFFALAFILWLGLVSIELRPLHLLEYALASGMIMSLHSPVRMSMAPRLIQRDLIPSAVNFTSINYNTSRMTGPALGGWAIAQIGTVQTTLAAALCYLPFLLALFLLRVRDAESGRPTHDFLRDFATGARSAFGDRGIRRALALSAVVSTIIFGSLEILPAIADGVFGRGASGLGLLTASAGFGAVAAGLALLAMPLAYGRDHLRTAVFICMFGVACVAGLGQTISWQHNRFRRGRIGGGQRLGDNLSVGGTDPDRRQDARAYHEHLGERHNRRQRDGCPGTRIRG